MDAKETVKQGLQARKDVKAAEARAEKLLEELISVNDARLHEQLRHQNDRRNWQMENGILAGTVHRQQHVIRQLRKEKEDLLRHEQNARQRHILIGAVKAVVILAALTAAKGQGWIVPWLVASLTAAAATYLIFAIVVLIRGNK